MLLAFIQGIGPLELVIVLAIVLLVLGPKRIPGLARSAGSGLRELKDSFRSDRDAATTPAARPALERPDEASGTPARVRAEAERR